LIEKERGKKEKKSMETEEERCPAFDFSRKEK